MTAGYNKNNNNKKYKNVQKMCGKDQRHSDEKK